jgi:hypothetical protein
MGRGYLAVDRAGRAVGADRATAPEAAAQVFATRTGLGHRTAKAAPPQTPMRRSLRSVRWNRP